MSQRVLSAFSFEPSLRHPLAAVTVGQDVYAAAERAEDPDAPLHSRAGTIGMLLSSGAGGQLCERYAAHSADEMVGER